MSLKKVIASCLKVGTIGFGGGSALIPITEKEVVADKKMISEEDFNEQVIVANITPGALPVKLGTGVGEHVSGVKGSVLGAFAMALPGAFFTILFLALLSIMPKSVLSYVEYASIGISAFIIYLLFHYITKVSKDSKAKNFLIHCLILVGIAFLLTGEKEIREFLEVVFGVTFGFGILFDISTVSLLILTFFFIFFTKGQIKSWRFPVAIAVSILFVLTKGKGQLIQSEIFEIITLAVMGVLALFFLLYDARKEIKENNTGFKVDFKRAIKTPLLCAVCFLAITAVIVVLCSLYFGKDFATVINYLSSGMISTVTSFGGGEAYLTVASGMFVETGIISSSVFFSQILPIANSLPGAILVKILSGMSYSFGFALSGNVLGGIILGIGGFSVAVGVSSAAFWLITIVYRSFSSLSVFKTLKLWILPVICGLLVTTVFAMLVEMGKIVGHKELTGILAVLLFGGIFAVAAFLKKKFKLNDLAVIGISAAISLIVLILI